LSFAKSPFISSLRKSLLYHPLYILSSSQSLSHYQAHATQVILSTVSKQVRYDLLNRKILYNLRPLSDYTTLSLPRRVTLFTTCRFISVWATPLSTTCSNDFLDNKVRQERNHAFPIMLSQCNASNTCVSMYSCTRNSIATAVRARPYFLSTCISCFRLFRSVIPLVPGTTRYYQVLLVVRHVMQVNSRRISTWYKLGLTHRILLTIRFDRRTLNLTLSAPFSSCSSCSSFLSNPFQRTVHLSHILNFAPTDNPLAAISTSISPCTSPNNNNNNNKRWPDSAALLKSRSSSSSSSS
jgi:hypothetical protein